MDHISRLLELFQLSDKGESPIRACSNGQKKKVAICGALVTEAPILVLDEPTSGLDEATAERLLSDVISTTAGKSLLYVTHRLDELTAFDEVDVIEDGRVVSRSTPEGRLARVGETSAGPA